MTAPRRTPKEYVEDLLLHCLRIEVYVREKTFDDFLTNTMLQDAVVRNIEVLGEASRHQMDACPDAERRFPTIPLRTMYVTRNRLIHGYSSLRLQTVWEVAVRDIPEVQAGVTSALASWPSDLS